MALVLLPTIEKRVVHITYNSFRIVWSILFRLVCFPIFKISLRSPSGTNSVLLRRRPLDTSSQGFEQWSFTSLHFWGENPVGNWTLTVDCGYYYGTFGQSAAWITGMVHVLGLWFDLWSLIYDHNSEAVIFSNAVCVTKASLTFRDTEFISVGSVWNLEITFWGTSTRREYNMSRDLWFICWMQWSWTQWMHNV